MSSLAEGLGDAPELLELAREEGDEETVAAVVSDLERWEHTLAELEFRRMFPGEADPSNAFLDIQAGSGGTEAQDWADMLMRMYLRWGERRGMQTELIEMSPGEVAGIKSATIRFVGDYAFGWLRTETGVHRLVRKSPFDSGHRRHTSFAAVFLSPEVDDRIEIDINPADLRIDVYRASGAGGQHVNRTESAVRITHLPSGAVVQCQNDRSQHKNKATAMKQLKAKLYELELQRRRDDQQAVEDTKSDIGWGSQIRSYVLDQSRIKDLRTGIEIGNTQAVLDGDLDRFIEASLKGGPVAPRNLREICERSMSDRESDQIRQRRDKLDALRAAGNPYPNDFRRSAHASQIHRDHADDDVETLLEKGVQVRVAGRMMSRRVMGKSSFADLRDVSDRIQLFIKRDALPEGDYAIFKQWDVGDILGAAGTVFRTRSGELSVAVDSIRLLSKCLRPLPEKWHGLADTETRYRQRYVDLIASEETRRTFRTRSNIITFIRRFFIERDYLEVETPMMQSLPGGAVARPFQTTTTPLAWTCICASRLSSI